MERRFMKNTDPLLTFAEMGESNGVLTWTDRELGAIYIDPRLCICPQVMSTECWKKARRIFKCGYVSFFVTAAKLKRQQQRDMNPTIMEEVNISDTVVGQALNGSNPTNRRVVLDDSSDDDSDDDAEGSIGFVVNTSEVVQQKHDSLEAELEATKICKRWEKYVVEYANDDFYCALYPEDNFPSTGSLDNVEHLLQLDVKPIYDRINEVNNKNKECFGLLPFMMGCSKFQLGALNSQSFSERINSAANIVVTEGTMKINPIFVDKLVTVRMNERFMKFVMTTKYKGSINLLADMEEMNHNNNTDNLWKEYDSSNK